MQVPCPKCCGCGEIELSEKLSEVYNLLNKTYPRYSEFCTASYKAAQLRISVPAMSNRLYKLFRMGLVERERIQQPSGGYEFFYWRKERMSNEENEGRVQRDDQQG